MLLFAMWCGWAGAQDRDDDERAYAPIEFDFSGDALAGNLGATPGGAQDITYFRDRVAAGEVPLPEVFTAEGLFSEHDLPLDAGPCGRLLCAAVAGAPAELVAQPDVRWLAQVGFSSGLDARTFRRAPVSLVAVVDRSCSMSGEPLATVKASLAAMIGQLGPADQLALVTYGEDVRTVLPPTSARDRAALVRAVDGIEIDGSTNMEAGLVRGFALARAARRGFDGTSRVVLFTDERPNVGATDADSFMGLAEAASRDGVGLTTIGVGVQFGAELAQKVSSVRGGNLFFFSDLAKMRAKFEREFDYLVTELAYDLDVVVTPDPGTRIAGVYGVPGELVEWTDGGGIRLKVATLFLSADDGAIYLAFASDGPRRVAERLGEVVLAYEPRDGVRSEERSVVSVASVPDLGLRRGELLVDEVTALKAATALHHEANDQEGAWQIVHALHARLAAAGDPDLAPELALVARLDDTLAALAGRQGEVLTTVRDPVSGLPRRR